MTATSGRNPGRLQPPLNRCRDILLARRADLRAQLRGASGALAQVGRPGDQGQARVLHDQFVSLRLNAVACEQLKLIEAALSRWDSGAYGTCADCDSAISAKRLAAIPWANRCLACQERLDLRAGVG